MTNEGLNTEGYILSNDEKELIRRAAQSKVFQCNPVPAEMKDELKDDFYSFVSVPYFRVRQLEQIYGSENIEDILQADWHEAQLSNAIALYKDDAITFAIHVANSRGYALNISIRKSQEGKGHKPWYLSYVPDFGRIDLPSERAGLTDSEVVEDLHDPSVLDAHATTEYETAEIDFVEPKDALFFYKPDEYAYARIEKFLTSDSPDQYEDKYVFRCIDGVSTSKIKKSVVEEHLGEQPEVGMCCWVRFKRLIKSGDWGSRYIAYLRDEKKGNQEYLDREHRVFCEHRNIGERVMAPILSTENGIATVALGPNTFIAVELPPWLSQKEASLSGKIGYFEIENLGSVGQIALRFVEGFDPEQAYKDKLPESLSEFIISSVVMDVIRSTPLDETSARKMAEMGIDMTSVSHGDFRRFVNKRYIEAKSRNHVYSKYRNDLFTFDFDLGIRTNEGAPLSACFKKGRDGCIVMNMYGFTSANRAFWRDISVTKEEWRVALNQLAELAMGDEEWDGSGQDGDKQILKSYLIFTYYKAWLDGLIVEGQNGNAVFNTGLVDEEYDSIYCCLKKIDKANDYDRKWTLGYFACWGKGRLGKRLPQEFPSKPDSPDYIDRNHLEDLILDTSKPIDCDWHHIVDDNFARLPLDFIERELGFDPLVRETIIKIREEGDEEDRRILREVVLDGGEKQRRITFALAQAKEIAEKHVRWNYKTAVPIYWPRRNRLSLLLPLNVCSPHNEADLALVISPSYVGGYQGETILDLSMAYKDARLVCRPCSEWLTTANANGKEDDE